MINARPPIPKTALIIFVKVSITGEFSMSSLCSMNLLHRWSISRTFSRLREERLKQSIIHEMQSSILILSLNLLVQRFLSHEKNWHILSQNIRYPLRSTWATSMCKSRYVEFLNLLEQIEHSLYIIMLLSFSKTTPPETEGPRCPLASSLPYKYSVPLMVRTSIAPSTEQRVISLYTDSEGVIQVITDLELASLIISFSYPIFIDILRQGGGMIGLPTLEVFVQALNALEPDHKLIECLVCHQIRNKSLEIEQNIVQEEIGKGKVPYVPLSAAQSLNPILQEGLSNSFHFLEHLLLENSFILLSKGCHRIQVHLSRLEGLANQSIDEYLVLEGLPQEISSICDSAEILPDGNDLCDFEVAVLQVGHPGVIGHLLRIVLEVIGPVDDPILIVDPQILKQVPQSLSGSPEIPV